MSEKTQINQKWAVVGGGMLGMLTALKLAKKGVDVKLFEARRNLGGLADQLEWKGLRFDRFYHVILYSDAYTRALLKELNLEEQLQWHETKTGFYVKGKLFSMSNSIEFLKFPPLSLIDKFRLGMTILYASRIKNAKKLQTLLVEDWLRKLSGRRVFEKIWLPLLKAKLGDQYKHTSASFIWTTIKRMYAARESGMKTELFGYLPGGYAMVLEKLKSKLEEHGVKIFTSHPLEVMKKTEEGFKLQFSGQSLQNADKVIMTIPSAYITDCCPDLTNEEKSKHKSIFYLGVVCPSVLLKKGISPYYVTNITDAWVPFTGVIEMTSLASKDMFDGKNLIYLPKYVDPEHELFAQPDEDVKAYFTENLLKMYPVLSSDDILDVFVSRARYVFALPVIDYPDKLPAVETSVNGLYILNNARITEGTLNVNDTIKLLENNFTYIMP